MPPFFSRPKSLQNEFDAYIQAVYPDPPTQNDRHPAVREQYRQLRDAFFGGAVVVDNASVSFTDELEQYLAAKIRARAQGESA